MDPADPGSKSEGESSIFEFATRSGEMSMEFCANENGVFCDSVGALGQRRFIRTLMALQHVGFPKRCGRYGWCDCAECERPFGSSTGVERQHT